MHLTLISMHTVFRMKILKTFLQELFLKQLPINSTMRLKQHVTWSKSTLRHYLMSTLILTTVKKENGCKTRLKDLVKSNFPTIRKFIFSRNWLKLKDLKNTFIRTSSALNVSQSKGWIRSYRCLTIYSGEWLKKTFLICKLVWRTADA